MKLVYILVSSPLVLKSSGLRSTYFDVRSCLRPKNLTEFSLDIYVTKSTLDDYGRRPNTISDIH